MIYGRTTYSDVVESFLLGLSCLVGGDQFYIFISQTEASPKTQSYIAITTVLATLFLAIIFYDEYNPSLFDVFHVIYLIMLMIWISILYQKVKDRFVTTFYNLTMTQVLTFLIILCSIHYSRRKDLLPSFLSGLLFARLLPTLIWTFLKEKKPEYEDNLSTLSMRLALFRLLFCVASIMIKITSGNLGFSEINFGNTDYGNWYVIRKNTVMTMYQKFKKLFIDSCRFYGCFSFIYPTSLFLFFSSIVLHLGRPPISHKLSHLYSHHFYTTIDMIRTVSHLFGVAIGTKYPVSKTTTSHYYPAIYLSYIYFGFSLIIVNHYFKIKSPVVLYTIVILTGFILGYVCSYSLVIIKNIFLLRTCIYEENQIGACCGEKTETRCYCRLESIVKGIHPGKNLRKLFSCSKLYCDKKKAFKYCVHGNCAILLTYNTNAESCTQPCTECCTGQCNGKCCLKLVGTYEIQSVTTTTCDNCNLSVRIEATCTDPSKCPSCCGSGGTCVCNSNGNKCCLCLKCCKNTCGSDDCKCCIHVCNGTSGCRCNCNCQSKEVEGVRVFICFEHNGKKCCIREIKPNLSKDFVPDLTIQNEFDIKNMFFWDCCHVDLTLDLQCSMKNNFFRLTPINYPKKTMEPLSLTLIRDGNECCKEPTEKCCCKNLDFVKVCVKYDGSEQNCQIKCNCKGRNGCCCSAVGAAGCQCCCCKDGTCCCCCLTCNLNVDKLSSFYNMAEPIRVKLVLILWFLVLIFLMISISESSKSKNKKLKYYEFFPIRSFHTVNAFVEKNNVNSMHTVLQRLRAAQEGIFLETFGERDKKHDLNHMLELCRSVLYQSSFNRLKHYVLSKSSMLIASPQYVNRRLDLELVKWSYCVGFAYTYIILMFFRIQNYFLIWEKVWNREYLNYRKTITSKFNKLTQTSKFSISLMCEVDVNQKTILYLNKTRTGDWSCAYDEIHRYTNLYDREVELSKPPPYRLDLRMAYFLDRWEQRVENIMFWIENETNVYDWSGLLREYPKIRNWFFNFLPHIEKASVEMNIPVEELNRGTEVLRMNTRV